MQLSDSPEWFPHLVTPSSEGISFLHLSERGFEEASFLDERLLGPTSESALMQWPDILAAGVGPRSAHYIFHIGHVGSTLLSRLIGAVPSAFSLREPAVLRTMATAIAQLGGARDDEGRNCTIKLTVLNDLLARTFHPRQRAIIKATSFTSELGARLQTARPGSKSLLMCVSPLVYMATILGGANGLNEARILAEPRSQRLRSRLGLDVDSQRLSPGPLLALSWLCEAASLAALSNEVGAAAYWLDFEYFLKKPRENLSRVFDHFDLQVATEDINAIVSRPLMQRYSKDMTFEYSHQLRRDVSEEAKRDFAGEISQGMTWLQHAAEVSTAAKLAMETVSRALVRSEL